MIIHILTVSLISCFNFRRRGPLFEREEYNTFPLDFFVGYNRMQLAQNQMGKVLPKLHPMKNTYEPNRDSYLNVLTLPFTQFFKFTFFLSDVVQISTILKDE